MRVTRCYSLGLCIIGATLCFVGAFLFLKPAHLCAVEGVHYVAPNGICDGVVPCYDSIQDAVDAAQPGDEVHIASGTYTGVNQYGGLRQLVYISKTITLRGGYSAEDWEQTLVLSVPTILNAEQDGRGIYITGEITTTIENLNIINSSASGMAGSPRFGNADAGGGIYAISATVGVNRVWLQNNTAVVGAGAYFENADLNLRDSAVISNMGVRLGGGIFVEGGNSLFTDNEIAGNGSDYGGGVAVYDGYSDEFLGNHIHSNQGDVQGGGILLSSTNGKLVRNNISNNFSGSGGGGVLSGNILVSQNTISNNIGDSGGGGLVIHYGNISLYDNKIIANRADSGWGGGIIISGSSARDPHIRIVSNNIISGNSAVIGGGVFVQMICSTFKGNIISGNTAEENAGGMLIHESTLTMDGDIMTDNTAGIDGGGLSLSQYSQLSSRNLVLTENQAGYEGSAISVVRSMLDLSHTTFSHNIGNSGIAVRLFEYTGGSSVLTLTNTILVSHTVGITVTENSTVTIDGMLWFGNGINAGGGGNYTIAHALEGDPAFAEDGYHLLATSAARDAGVPSGVYYDIDNEPRPSGALDLGADEYWEEGALKRLYLPMVQTSAYIQD
ncbi:MAG: right-handed parallel beta-helix repeat-containing protein [Anaerolineae bacterium]|nr:right-handed parallel beta-helix repeat-containing protein [Anaerolineae bacterium]